MADWNAEESLAQPRLRESLEEVRPKLAEVQSTELLPLNVDPLDAAATVRAALPALLELRASIEKQLIYFDLSDLDQLETLSLALIQSHSLYRCAKAPPAELFRVIGEATQLRDRFLSDVAVLSKRGSMKGCRLKSFRGAPSYRQIASDVLTLSNLLRNSWQAVSTKCGVTEAELDRAEVLAEQLIRLLGSRERAPARVAEAARVRQKVYTLLVRAYDQVRKAVHYLRWERGDAERIAPSIYGGRKVLRRTTVAELPAEHAAVPTPNVASPLTPQADPGSDPFLN